MSRQTSNLIAVLSALATLLFTAGCASGLTAYHDHDPSARFEGYRTFAWISEHPMKVGPSSTIANPMVEPRIMSAIEAELQRKGYTRVDDPEMADFVLAFTVGSREQIEVDSYPTMAGGVGYAYPRHWRSWGGAYYGHGTETRVRQYTEGMLAIDIFDGKERRPVWHGVASKSINASDRENASASIQGAVDAILAGFPPS